jgi:hypothetical protein
VLTCCDPLTRYYVLVSIDAEYNSFMLRYEVASAEDLAILREEGQALAARLRSAAIDLSSSKATEFSPRIEEYILMAAKVAFLAYGAGAAGLRPYEQDVYYYRNFDPPSYIVSEYERFKRGQQST